MKTLCVSLASAVLFGAAVCDYLSLPVVYRTIRGPVACEISGRIENVQTSACREVLAGRYLNEYVAPGTTAEGIKSR